MTNKDRKGFFTIATGAGVHRHKVYDDNIPERSIAQPLPTAKVVKSEEDENLTQEEKKKVRAKAIKQNSVSKNKKKEEKIEDEAECSDIDENEENDEELRDS